MLCFKENKGDEFRSIYFQILSREIQILNATRFYYKNLYERWKEVITS